MQGLSCQTVFGAEETASYYYNKSLFGFITFFIPLYPSPQYFFINFAKKFPDSFPRKLLIF